MDFTSSCCRLLILAIISLMITFFCGCVVSPVPKNIREMHFRTKRDVPIIESIARPGDIIFRLSKIRVLNGSINFSKMIAELSDSDFSHAAIIYDVTKHGAIIADVSVNGIELIFLRDWYIDQTSNCVLKRLKPEYSHLLPKILDTLHILVEEDVLYDEKFQFGDEYYYCTEIVDHCFRQAGLPLAEPIPIRELPGFGWGHTIMGWLAGLDLDQPVVIAGNDEIGLFSSNTLETVVDFRD